MRNRLLIVLLVVALTLLVIEGAAQAHGIYVAYTSFSTSCLFGKEVANVDVTNPSSTESAPVHTHFITSGHQDDYDDYYTIPTNGWHRYSHTSSKNILWGDTDVTTPYDESNPPYKSGSSSYCR